MGWDSLHTHQDSIDVDLFQLLVYAVLSNMVHLMLIVLLLHKHILL